MIDTSDILKDPDDIGATVQTTCEYFSLLLKNKWILEETVGYCKFSQEVFQCVCRYVTFIRLGKKTKANDDYIINTTQPKLGF